MSTIFFTVLCTLLFSLAIADEWIDESVLEEEEVTLSDIDFIRGAEIKSQNKEAVNGEYNDNKFEGDIVTPGLKGKEVEKFLEDGFYPDIDDPAGLMHNAIRNKYQMWDNREVPYTLSSRYSSKSKAVIASAMDEYAKRTCLRFVPRTTQRDYVYIAPDDGCYSLVGKTGYRQLISLDSGCMDKGVIIHEMMHTVGFFHEQSRTDRDSYIDIQWNNIRPGLEDQFEKYSQSLIQHLGADYDYGSIMHYRRNAFSRNGRDTIVPKQSGAIIGQRDGFSSTDAYKVNKLYQCDGPSGLFTDRPDPATPQPRPRPTAPPPTPSVSCRNEVDEKCENLARIGWCEENSRVMRHVCPLACGFCRGLVTDRPDLATPQPRPRPTAPPPTPSVSCRNEVDDQCENLARIGWCEENSRVMRHTCPLACGFCRGLVTDRPDLATPQPRPRPTAPPPTPSVSCRNEVDDQCENLARIGWCEENSRVMRHTCPLACGFCRGLVTDRPDLATPQPRPRPTAPPPTPSVSCRNEVDDQCENLARIGWCEENSRVMRHTCPLACGFCRETNGGDGSTSRCRDQMSSCSMFAEFGLCQSSPIQSSCEKTCGVCW